MLSQNMVITKGNYWKKTINCHSVLTGFLQSIVIVDFRSDFYYPTESIKKIQISIKRKVCIKSAISCYKKLQMVQHAPCESLVEDSSPMDDVPVVTGGSLGTDGIEHGIEVGPIARHHVLLPQLKVLTDIGEWN